MDQTHILIIEDDELVARTIERCLRREKYKITISNSGVEGLRTARSLLPDFVILDVIMPGMDGYKVCRGIRNDPLISSVPVMFLSAKNTDADKINGFIAGCDDFLTKPFNLDELIWRIRAILRRGCNQKQRANESEKINAPGPSSLAASDSQKTQPPSDAATKRHCIVCQ